MNKKFSTLLATLLVAGGMSSASAAMTGTVFTARYGKDYED